MSGEADGLLMLPFLLAGLTVYGTYLVGRAAVRGGVAAVDAIQRHNEEKREREAQMYGSSVQQNANAQSARNVVSTPVTTQRPAGTVRTQYTGQPAGGNTEAQRRAADKVGNLRRQMNADLAAGTAQNEAASAAMMQEMEKSRRQMLQVMEGGDPAKYQEYLTSIKESRAALERSMQEVHQSYIRDYSSKISESVANTTANVNREYTTALEQISALAADAAAKEKLARETAEEYIEEAKALLISMEEDYEGARFSRRQLTDLQATLNAAIAQYNMGNYESALAAAKDVSMSTIEEIYNTEVRRQEWDSYFQSALALATEITAYLEEQEVVTEEGRCEAEEKLGRHLDEDIVGVRIGEYTDKMKDGRTQYDYLLGKSREIRDFLMSEQAESLSAEQLKEYSELLNTKIYPSAALAMYKGILNMSNAFSRQNISEEIIDFFEEHNFEFTGYSYDEDRHDGALHIGLANDVTGEEIVVTLAPEVMENGDVQTRVSIDELQGDETNEERKQYFRDSVEQVVAGSTPGAQIKLSCRQETRNKLSRNTGLRDKLKND